MVDDFDDCYKRYLDYFTIGALDFDARLGQCLSCFHAAHGSSNARAVVRKYLDVVFTVERLESRQSFSYFHFLFTALSLPDWFAAIRGHLVRTACGSGRLIYRFRLLVRWVHRPLPRRVGVLTTYYSGGWALFERTLIPESPTTRIRRASPKGTPDAA